MTINGKNLEKATELKKARRLKVGDPDFVPPDGGWGWLVVFACGFSNLSTFPMFQQFGLVFRQKFQNLNITNTQTTTVINLNSAFNSCVGLFNGPIYRHFTYRQVAIFGSLLVASSLFISTMCESFWSYLVFYAMCYGTGIGITQGANALALNTFFKNKRRIATGFSWSTTALGPIVWPYIITALLDVYGTEGTLLVFSSFALHAFLCSLLLQPVEWHTKFRDIDPEGVTPLIKQITKPASIFSSQYLHNEDDPEYTGYEIIDPGYPMMVKANDGWYSRKSSLEASIRSSKRPSYTNLLEIRSKKNSTMNLVKPIHEEDEAMIPKEYHEKEVLTTAAKKLEEFAEEDLSFFQKVCIFFDFDLFKDPIYVNIMLGITLANFVEINFSIITPMVLEEFNFGKYEIATFMSLLGSADILVRFFVPFLAEKIPWDNRTFFLFGVLSMAFGRILLVHTQSYFWGLVVAVIIGAGKGLRTIFMALVIPSHVALERLPAASGLQLATSGLFFLVLGPVVGWIRDVTTNYVITLHILNIMTYTTAITWTIERYLCNKPNEGKT